MRCVYVIASILVAFSSSTVNGDPPTKSEPPARMVGQATLSIDITRGPDSDELIAKRIQRIITLKDNSNPFRTIKKVHPGRRICWIRVRYDSITYKGHPQQPWPVTFNYQISKDADGKYYFCKGGLAIARIDPTSDLYAAAVNLLAL